MIIDKRLYKNFILSRIFANTQKFNPLEVPYISNRYITPTWDINDDALNNSSIVWELNNNIFE